MDKRVEEAVEAMKHGDYSLAETLMEEAREEGARKQREVETAHAEFHGRPLKYITVERRHGYRGRTVCRDCYYIKEWH